MHDNNKLYSRYVGNSSSMTTFSVLMYKIITGKFTTTLFTREELNIEIFSFGVCIFWNNSNYPTSSSTTPSSTTTTTSTGSTRNPFFITRATTDAATTATVTC